MQSVDIWSEQKDCERDFRREVEDNFMSCPVCYDHFSEHDDQSPHILNCGHTLCRRCINQITSERHTSECPFCKHAMHRSRGVPHYPKNFIVLGMLNFFPKLQHSIPLQKYIQQDIESAQSSNYECGREVEFYAHLIATQEADLNRLRLLHAEAEKARDEAEARIHQLKLNKTLLQITDDGGTSIPIQCRLSAPPPPPPRAELQIPHSRADLLNDIRLGRNSASQTHMSHAAPQPPPLPPRVAMADQLRIRLEQRRRVIQPTAVIPERPRHTSLSELERVFQRRTQGVANWAARDQYDSVV